ncbi:unnamed protein product [Vitrella brassicaformis CCMP3155]|uniref:peptidylprolyl isomerase n=1 Tax=Vitrella brassicaformis (strain CCMP3155) TaxID=1169540 RepID=A0A0G4EXB1_VITBC|nr:unnamed protein product [Vitrella brassicaformis CCMP3155]|eukprot:CEM02730.1 unnamed protein product [Vitrella brassicaformis CCMP3155]
MRSADARSLTERRRQKGSAFILQQLQLPGGITPRTRAHRRVRVAPAVYASKAKGFAVDSERDQRRGGGEGPSSVKKVARSLPPPTPKGRAIKRRRSEIQRDREGKAATDSGEGNDTVAYEDLPEEEQIKRKKRAKQAYIEGAYMEKKQREDADAFQHRLKQRAQQEDIQLITKGKEVNVSLEPEVNSTVTVNVQVDGNFTQQMWEVVLADLNEEAAIKGFQKGKTPTEVLVNRIGIEPVKARCVEYTVYALTPKVLRKLPIQSIGTARTEGSRRTLAGFFRPGEPFQFQIETDVWPSIAFAKHPHTGEDMYRQLEVTAVKPDFDFRMHRYRYELRHNHAKLVPTPDDRALWGDALVAERVETFLVGENGTVGQQLTGPEFTLADEVLHLVPHVHLDGLVEGCIGMRQGESRLVKVSTAGSSGGAEQGAADADADADHDGDQGLEQDDEGDEDAELFLNVTNVRVMAREVPDLSDALARQAANMTLKELLGQVEDKLLKQCQDDRERNLRAGVIAALLECTNLTIPETLIVEHGKGKYEMLLKTEASKGHDVSKLTNAAALNDYLRRKQAAITQELQASFILDEIAEREGLTVAPDELQINIDTVQQDMKKLKLVESRVQSKLEAMLMAQRVIDWITERSSITWVDEAELYGGNLDDRLDTLMRQTDATTPTTDTHSDSAPTAKMSAEDVLARRALRTVSSVR